MMNINTLEIKHIKKQINVIKSQLFITTIICALAIFAYCYPLNSILSTGLIFLSAAAIMFHFFTQKTIIKELLHQYELLTTKNKNLTYALAESTLVSETDVSGIITDANDRFCKLSGYSKEELVGKNHSIINSGEHPTEFFKDMWDTIQNGKVWKGEVKNRAKDGSCYWVDATISPIFDAKGTISSFIAVRFDITKRKLVEVQLRRKQSSLLQVKDRLNHALKLEKVVGDILEVSSKPYDLKRKLIESLDIILKLSWLPIKAQGAIFLVSKEKEELLTLEAQINLATPLITLCDKVEFGHCLCGRAAKEKQIMFASCIDERHDIRFDQMSPHGHYNIPLIFRGKLLGVMVIYLDHGHQKSRSEMDSLLLFSRAIGQMIEGAQTIEDLGQERSKLIQSSKMSTLGEMAGGISHELNNPLAIVQGYASILKKMSREADSVPSEVVQSMTVKIEYSVTRMSKIIDGLRNFARDGQMDIQVVTNLSALINETLSYCRGRFTNQAVELEINIPKTISIKCQEVQISQVVLNLLNNALDALAELPSSEKRVIKINAIEENQFVILTISDSGRGAAKEIESKIFDPFFTTKAIGKGTGLGLSISLGIIEAHGGKISYSRSNEWTQIQVSLPTMGRATD